MHLLKRAVRKAKLTLLQAILPESRHGTLTFAQCGEDIIVSYVFSLRGISKPTYIDIGAHHPFRLSNTALFYQRGSRGVNIEPNPEQFSSFLKYRSQDINLNVGIGGSESTQTFYCLEDAPLSTFSAAEAAAFQRHGHKLKAELQLQVLPIGKIITDHCNGRFPDFMNLDVEGFETEILSSVDFINDYPKVICIETANYSPTGNGPKRHELMSFLEKKNYFLYADTNLNSIYVHRVFWTSAIATESP